ncbi:hypothetical protein C8R44DRAFT_21274 [Mycena epipterygia]|nr:hypothetical protein C8R44DRAFT_21274 [Mycena epipterygia]
MTRFASQTPLLLCFEFPFFLRRPALSALLWPFQIALQRWTEPVFLFSAATLFRQRVSFVNDEVRTSQAGVLGHSYWDFGDNTSCPHRYYRVRCGALLFLSAARLRPHLVFCIFFSSYSCPCVSARLRSRPPGSLVHLRSRVFREQALISVGGRLCSRPSRAQISFGWRAGFLFFYASLPPSVRR